MRQSRGGTFVSLEKEGDEGRDGIEGAAARGDAVDVGEEGRDAVEPAGEEERGPGCLGVWVWVGGIR